MNIFTTPEYTPGTPEYAARVAAQQKAWEERQAREAQEKLDEAARKEALAAQKQADAEAEIRRRKEELKACGAELGNIEERLAIQARRLDSMFSQALDDYAGAGDLYEKARVFSGIALKAQNYCRMTLSSIIRWKNIGAFSLIAGENAKNDKQAIIRSGNEALDTGGTVETGGSDSHLVPMENQGEQNAGSQAGQPA